MFSHKGLMKKEKKTNDGILKGMTKEQEENQEKLKKGF